MDNPSTEFAAVSEISGWLRQLIDGGWCKENEVDGFIFVESGFRVKED